MKRLLLTLLFIFFVTPAWGAGEITVWDATETSQHGGAYDTLAAALANAATVAGDHVILSGNAAAETTSVPTVIDDNIEIKSDTPGTKRTVSASGSIVNLLKITKTGCTVTDILFDGVTNTTSNVVWVENNLNSTAVSIRATFNNCEIQNIASGSHGIFGCSTDAGDGAVNLSINTCKFTANSTTSFGVYSYSVGGTTPIGSVTIINSIFIRPAANGITGYSTAGGVYIDAGNTGTISKSYFETPGASSGAYSLNCGIVVGVDTTANVFNNYFSTAITALTNRFSVALLDTGGTINFWGNIVNGNTAGGAVWSYGAEATDSFVVHNNTFLNCGNAFNFASTPTFASIKNNIFYGTTYPFRKETGAAPIGFGALPSAASCSNNLYYPCAAAANISDDATTVFSDAEYADATNIINEDPLFYAVGSPLTGLWPVYNSPVWDEGVDVTSEDADFARILGRNTTFHATVPSSIVVNSVDQTSADIDNFGMGAYAKQSQFYVSNVAGDIGSDSNSGMSDSPLLTLARTQALAVDNADDVYLKKGSTFAETWTQPVSGLAADVYNLGAYGSTGAKPILNNIVGAAYDYITVDGLEVYDATPIDNVNNIETTVGSTNWTVKNCTIHGASGTGDGINMVNSGAVIENNHVYTNADIGIDISDATALVRYNKVHDNATGFFISGDTATLQANITYDNTTGILIANLMTLTNLYNHTDYGSGTGVNVTGTLSDMKNCIFYENATNGVSVGGTLTVHSNNNATDWNGEAAGTGDLTNADPKFKDVTAGYEKLWITNGSPCSSAGTDTTICEYLLETKSVWPSAVTTQLAPQKHIPMGAYIGPKKSLFPVLPIFMKVWD